MHPNSMLLFEKYALPYIKQNMKVLEIGPDLFPSTYQQLSRDITQTWHTLDMLDDPKLTYPKSGEYEFAIPDGAYDVVLSGSVIEHVRKPWKWVPELARVTKSGGLVITVNPVSWWYHEQPVDCWRMYPEGMKALYEDAGLTVLMSRFESLEALNYRRHIAGISETFQSRKRRFLNRAFGPFGFPVERAIDTITIGRKEH
jgi:hypothetical protein